jgi:hypothetical protein
LDLIAIYLANARLDHYRMAHLRLEVTLYAHPAQSSPVITQPGRDYMRPLRDA